MTSKREYKKKLAATREADRLHEAEMLKLFEGDKRALKEARGRPTRSEKDAAFMSQILKVKKT